MRMMAEKHASTSMLDFDGYCFFLNSPMNRLPKSPMDNSFIYIYICTLIPIWTLVRWKKKFYRSFNVDFLRDRLIDVSLRKPRLHLQIVTNCFNGLWKKIINHFLFFWFWSSFFVYFLLFGIFLFVYSHFLQENVRNIL